jgi:hypothetical protein
MILMGASFSVLNYYATGRHLIEAQQRLSFRRQVLYSVGLVMYAVGTALSFVDARIALIIYAGLAVYYVVEPLIAFRPVVNSEIP